MRAAHKIIDGLKNALGYARCRHEFTHWQEVIRSEVRIPVARKWKRKCTKCKTVEYQLSNFEPAA